MGIPETLRMTYKVAQAVGDLAGWTSGENWKAIVETASTFTSWIPILGREDVQIAAGYCGAVFIIIFGGGLVIDRIRDRQNAAPELPASEQNRLSLTDAESTLGAPVVRATKSECRLNDGRIIRFDPSRAQNWSHKQKSQITIDGSYSCSRAETLWNLDSGIWLVEESELNADSAAWREIDHEHAALWLLIHNEPIPRSLRAVIDWRRPPGDLAAYLPQVLKATPQLLDAVKDLLPQKLNVEPQDNTTADGVLNAKEFETASGTLESLLVKVVAVPVIIDGEETSAGDANRKQIIRNTLAHAERWLELHRQCIDRAEGVLVELRSDPDDVFRFLGNAYTSAHAAARSFVFGFYGSSWEWLECQGTPLDFPQRKINLNLLDEKWDRFLFFARRLLQKNHDTEVLGAILRKERIAVMERLTDRKPLQNQPPSNNGEHHKTTSDAPPQRAVSSAVDDEPGIGLADKRRRLNEVRELLDERSKELGEIKSKKQAVALCAKVAKEFEMIFRDPKNANEFSVYIDKMNNRVLSYKDVVKDGIHYIDTVRRLLHERQLKR